jgi:alanine racemase
MAFQPLQWIEIDSQALRCNIQQFRSLIGSGRRLLAMVKSNAYGHGILPASRIAVEEGVDWLGVNDLEEGILLRRNGLTCPILVVGYIPLDDLKTAVDFGLSLTVYNHETLNLLSKAAQNAGRPAHVHIKVETGTHRQGIRENEVLKFLQKICDLPGLKLEGLSSHFANIEDTTDHSYAKYQLEKFLRICHQIQEKGIFIPIKHFSCSAAVILFPETYFDMVRVGVGIYGLWPSREVYVSNLLSRRHPFRLKPVLSWKSRVAQVKQVAKNAYIGYGCTYKTTRDTLLAVVPVGYRDGYRRALSDLTYVLIQGQRAPVRGRICMNFMMADITDIEGVRLEDEVVLVGRSGSENITVDYLADLMESINYEFVAGIHPSIPRILK